MSAAVVGVTLNLVKSLGTFPQPLHENPRQLQKTAFSIVMHLFRWCAIQSLFSATHNFRIGCWLRVTLHSNVFVVAELSSPKPSFECNVKGVSPFSFKSFFERFA